VESDAIRPIISGQDLASKPGGPSKAAGVETSVDMYIRTRLDINVRSKGIAYEPQQIQIC